MWTAPMPNVNPNNTQIPAPRVEFIDKATNFVSRAWYTWLFNIYQAVQAGERYGSYYDTTTQSAAAINTAYDVTFNSAYVDASNNTLQYGVYVGSPTSRIYVDTTSTYNFQFSLQLTSSSGSAQNVYIWADVNGTSVPYSGTKVTLQGSNAASVAAWNFVLNLQKGDYFRLMWSTDNTNVKITAFSNSSPVPAIPSAILTVTSIVGA